MIKSSNILKSSALQNDLSEKGYAVFPLLTENQIEALKQFYYENAQESNEGLVATAHHQNFDYRNKMSNFIHATVRDAVNQNFNQVQLLGGTFMAKNGGEKGVLHPHQDWNIVDEDKFASYNLWIPLVDVDTQNGTIEVIEGSHVWQKGFRGPNLHGPFANQATSLWQQMKPLNLKAGEVLLYDHRLLHASNMNNTATPRLVVVFGVIPAEAKMLFYYEEKGKVEVYESNKDFFLNQNPWEGPIGLKKAKQNLFKKLLAWIR